MYQVTREIDFCYGHRLLNYDGKCRHLHGHNGRAVLTLAAPELDGLGMVMDFSHFGVPVQITAPPAADTVSYASFLKSLGLGGTP